MRIEQVLVGCSSFFKVTLASYMEEENFEISIKQKSSDLCHIISDNLKSKVLNCAKRTYMDIKGPQNLHSGIEFNKQNHITGSQYSIREREIERACALYDPLRRVATLA
uniref:Uncharacterized protein n=1 Tax=Glossina pallidipes TaxID=7398 RepID=A0A1A9ZMD4_GLOPL